MSQQTVCDGCGKRLADSRGQGTERPAIMGERANDSGGGGLPTGRFDWCYSCATIGFAAVREAQLAKEVQRG